MTAPYYITPDDVKNRLYGKVLFVTPPYILSADLRYIITATDGTPLGQEMGYLTYNAYTSNPIYNNQGLNENLLIDMIIKAETEVCHDFSPFYVMPIVGSNGETWNMMQTLPEFAYPVNYFKNAFILKACIEVCKFEFGRNSNTNGEGILKYLQSEYDTIKDKLYTKNDNGRYIYPPVPSIKITGYVQYQMGFAPPRTCGPCATDTFLYANKQVPNARLNWIYPYPYSVRYGTT